MRGVIRLILVRIIPSCLRVEKATIRLKSFSIIAAQLPLSSVNTPIDIAMADERGAHESLSHRMRPAVTSVDE
jgi:hypothetical protein